MNDRTKTLFSYLVLAVTIFTVGCGYQQQQSKFQMSFLPSAPAAPVADIPGPLFLSGQPNLRVVSVAGIFAPAAPTGNMDVSLPSTTTNPAIPGVPVPSWPTTRPAESDPQLLAPFLARHRRRS